jgi:hypothetical protein
MAARGIARTRLGKGASHHGFLEHRRYLWLKIALALSVLTLLGYVLIDVQPRPNGGSWYGYTLGTIGALLIVWLSLLGVRKRAITAGHWSLKAWTSAHVYLGLSLVIVATLHTGFQLGWNVHTLAYALMMLVIASGVYGVVAYATLPQALSDNRRAMTKAQMVEALAAIDRQLDAAAQPLAREQADLVIAALAQDPFGAGLVARLSGRHRDCQTSRALAAFGEAGDERVAALLRKREAQLGQVRRHLRLRALLEVWLYLHVPLSAMLLAALAAHVISVFYYW